MPSIDELLAARAAAKPKPIEVTVLLDADTSKELEELEAQLEAIAADEDKRLGAEDGAEAIQERIDELKASTAQALVTFAFEKLPGDMWIDLTSRNPMRPGALVDMNYGYNLDAVAQAAVKAERGGHHFAWQVDGEKTVVLTDAQWDAVFAELYGHDAQAVRDAVWEVNEWGPSQKLVEAKKARAGSGTGSN
ncbi:hypothetical protein [Leifsonia virtsii]|uniref:Tail assembly chaperone n=1 Tax=Leifsonia virtsii TaxID=3035915 RepID=A0ABT8ISY5_9MICO|nr:hypothetical protein [Leifsonia virtsii]MDN4595901.1 hypothetical protein [Leifsonia virtsii]